MGFDKNCEEKTNKQTQIVVVIVVHPLETEVNDLFQGKAGEQGVSVLLQVHTQWNILKIPSKWQDLQKISPESWKVLKGVKILLNGRSIDGRNFTLEKMARSLFGEDICWAFYSSYLLSDIFKTFLLLCITCCTNINQRAFLRFFSSDSKIFESPCCTLKTSMLSATSHWRRATKPSGLDGEQSQEVGRHRTNVIWLSCGAPISSSHHTHCIL